MIHIHIACVPEDRRFTQSLSRKLLRYSRKNDLPETVIDDEVFSPDPDAKNFLILVCSPACVHDEKLAQKICLFCENAPSDQIISHVHKGIPNTKDPAKECLPAVLKELGLSDLIACNPLQTGRRIAFHKLISAIYGISLEQLEQRAQKYRTQRTITIVCALVFLAAFLIFEHFNTHTIVLHYRSFHYKQGAPVGDGWLGPWPQLFADDYYDLTLRNWQFISLATVGDPEGCKVDDPDVQAYYDAIHAPYIRFAYRQDGQLDTAIYCKADTVAFAINYLADGAAADFSRDPACLEPYYLFPDGEQTGYSRCVFTYDRRGNLTDIQYFPNSRNER